MAVHKAKVHEVQLRRWATRLGYRITRSRAKRLHADNFGRWAVIDASRNTIVAGSRFELDIEAVETFLRQAQAALEKEAAA